MIPLEEHRRLVSGLQKECDKRSMHVSDVNTYAYAWQIFHSARADNSVPTDLSNETIERVFRDVFTSLKR